MKAVSAPPVEPFVVHLPKSWSKLRQVIELGREKAGFTPRYKARCSGRKVELPPNVKVAEADGKPHFVAGPHERYYELCPGCERAAR